MTRLGTFVSFALAGFLLGGVMGLSVTPVVATVFTAGATIAVAFLAAKQEGGGNGETNWSSLSLAAFCVAALLAIPLGVMVRTHGFLSPGASSVFNEWRAIGFSDEDARCIATFSQLGLLPPGWEAVGPQPRTIIQGGLYSTSRDTCFALNPERYAADSESLCVAWEAVGKECAKVMRSLSDEEMFLLARSLHQFFCKGS